MQGVVFTEFLELVEGEFGADTLDAILDAVETETDGAYTAIGSYDFNELVSLVGALSNETGVAVEVLLKTFGTFLFGRLIAMYPQFVDSAEDAFTCLKSVEGTIHVEVRKLYPDAELPSFEWQQPQPGEMVMEYSSARPFALVAEGLIQGCIEHFEQDINAESRNPCGAEREHGLVEMMVHRIFKSSLLSTIS